MELATLLVERCLPEALEPLAGGQLARGCLGSSLAGWCSKTVQGLKPGIYW